MGGSQPLFESCRGTSSLVQSRYVGTSALWQLTRDFRHAADRVLHITDISFRAVERACIKM